LSFNREAIRPVHGGWPRFFSEVRMRIAGLLAIALAMLAACEHSGSPTPVPSAVATISIVPTAVVAAAATAPSPGASARPLPASDDDDDDDFDKPSGPDFEIDADADWYFGFNPMTVHFTAHALNGTPPFKFVWNFGDASSEATGDSAVHFYDKVGRYNAFVVGTAANGETDRVDLIIGVVTPEEYAERKGLDVSQLRPVPSPTATP
jgi:hypothetical protein